MGIATHAAGQATAPAAYQVYTLRYKPAAEVQKTLDQMLAGFGGETHLVIDQRTNQILLHGPEAAQQVARQTIEAMDRPQAAPPPAAAAALPPVAAAVVKAYPCPPQRQGELTARWQAEFANRADVKIAADAQTAQIFVLAPADVHAVLAQHLAVEGLSSANVPLPPYQQAGQAAPPTGGPPDVRSTFVGLLNARIEQVESTLARLWGPRLTLAGGRPAETPVYVLGQGTGKQVELRIDRARNGVEVVGPEAVSQQVVRLLQFLDSPPQPGRAQRLLPVHNADPAKVEQAVRTYRSAGWPQGGPEMPPAVPRSSDPSAPGMSPSRDSSSNDPLARGSIGLVAYLFQPDAAGKGVIPATPGPTQMPPLPAQPGVAAGAAGTTAIAPKPSAQTLQQLHALASDVDVDVLPDLDAIILRGRDQDVAELSRIIEELERLSAETQPAIELYLLQNVGDDALSALINQVNTAITGGLQGRVAVMPLSRPNALLIIGWGEAVKAIKDLIVKLDQPAPPQFRTFPLKHAPAAAVQATLTQFFATRSGLAGRILVSADPRTNALLVQAPPRDLLEVAAMVEALDRDQSASVNQTRIVKLRYTLAMDLTTTLQAAISASRTATPGAPAAPSGGAGGKSSILELLTVDPAGQKILKSGILSDVQITPDPRLNILIVSAPAESLELVLALIQQLDAPVSAAQIKVFRVVNGDAGALVLMLRSLLARDTPSGTPGTLPLPVSAEETGLAPLRFSIDTRTNSIIAVGSSNDLRIVEALLLRLDEQDVAQRKTNVFRLKNAPALDVASAVNEFLRSERTLQQAMPGVVGPNQQVESEVVVVPEPVSNTLILSATPRYFQKITDLIERLDEQRAQVLIQVLIAEVSLSNIDEFGIELGLQDSVLFDRSLLGNLITTTTTSQVTTNNGSGGTTSTATTQQNVLSATNEPGYNFNNTNPLGNSGTSNATANANQVGGQGLSNFNLGRTNSNLGFGGLVLSASSENVSALLRALQQLECMRVISRPQVMTLDNQPAYIQVGKRVPRITGTAVNQIGQVNSVALENVGLILGVTPRISPEGLVAMEIDAEKSDVGPEAEGIPISVSANGNIIRSPFINVTMTQTTISAASGQTVVLGGLITRSQTTIDRRVPWLADIPVLGNLFQYKSNDTERTELLIILTPHVIRSAEDEERAKEIEAARMHWCLRDVETIHGDLGIAHAVGATVVYPDANPRGVLTPAGQPAPGSELPPEAVPTPAPPGTPAKSSGLLKWPSLKPTATPATSAPGAAAAAAPSGVVPTGHVEPLPPVGESPTAQPIPAQAPPGYGPQASAAPVVPQ